MITGVDFVTVPARDFNLTLAVMEPTALEQEFRPHSLPIAFQVDDVAHRDA